MKFTNTRQHHIPGPKLDKSLQTAVAATILINSISLPDKPKDYISQYQLDIITMALGLDPIQNSAAISLENKYPIMMEFPLAMEGCRAGLFKLNELGEEV